MEKLSSLRCFRKSTTCFILVCSLFLFFALYAVYLDYGARIPYTNYIFESADSKKTELEEVHLDNVHVFERIGRVALREEDTRNSVGRGNASKGNKPARLPSVQAETKYIYVSNASAGPAASSSAASPYTTATPPSDTCQLKMRDFKVILLWTPFFNSWNYVSNRSISKCPHCRNCLVTTDRSRLRESDALVFHARDLSVSDLPSVRLPHQRWIFYCLESPPYSDFPGLQYMQDMFNWTMTYRSDSDILAQYGSVSKIYPSKRLDLEYLAGVWSNKTRSVIWMSSHCPTHGGRDAFVNELRRHIDVDVFGTCGHHSCPPGATDTCLRDFSLKYKFFLAFENSLCKDYITEKFFRTLKYDIVPVVFGGADYDKFAPPGSYINARSFKSPKHLAFFLHGIGSNFKLYSSYFKWRRDYAVNMISNKECQLCSLLHSKNSKPSSYDDLRKWWVSGSKCTVWKQNR